MLKNQYKIYKRVAERSIYEKKYPDNFSMFSGIKELKKSWKSYFYLEEFLKNMANKNFPRISLKRKTLDRKFGHDKKFTKI